jgi:hypothetical protein
LRSISENELTEPNHETFVLSAVEAYKFWIPGELTGSIAGPSAASGRPFARSPQDENPRALRRAGYTLLLTEHGARALPAIVRLPTCLNYNPTSVA